MGTPAPCGTDGSCEMTQICDDGNPCTINDIEVILLSDGSICQPCAGTPLDCSSGATTVQACDDGDPATVDDVETILDCNGEVCIPCLGVLSECETGPTTVQPCDDNDPCTINDVETFIDGTTIICVPCLGTPAPCGTNGSCETSVPCDDGDECTTNDVEIVLTSDGSVCQPCAGVPISIGDVFAEDDEFIANFGTLLEEQVTTNDNLNTTEELTISVNTPPMEGTLDFEEDGSFSYEANSPSVGSDLFTYSICLETCPDICTDGLVNISVIFDELVIPDAFSPNNDGIKDTWVIPGIDQFPNNQLVVVNRWGNVVFSADNYQSDWDGTSNNNRPLDEGTYYYDIILDLGEGEAFQGSITIIR